MQTMPRLILLLYVLLSSLPSAPKKKTKVFILLKYSEYIEYVMYVCVYMGSLAQSNLSEICDEYFSRRDPYHIISALLNFIASAHHKEHTTRRERERKMNFVRNANAVGFFFVFVTHRIAVVCDAKYKLKYNVHKDLNNHVYTHIVQQWFGKSFAIRTKCGKWSFFWQKKREQAVAADVVVNRTEHI